MDIAEAFHREKVTKLANAPDLRSGLRDAPLLYPKFRKRRIPAPTNPF
jgi:hypothetical protein